MVDALLAVLLAAPTGWPFPFPPVAVPFLVVGAAYSARILAPTSRP